MSKLASDIRKIVQEHSLYHPQEQLLEVMKDKKQLVIGIPKELFDENRIALRPESVAILTSRGHEVFVEAGAGELSHYDDKDYSEAGAKIVYSPEEVYSAELILKVAPPTIEEIAYMKPRTTIISAIHLAEVKSDYLKALNKKKITAVGYEFLEDEQGNLPLVRAMSEIAGNVAVSIAAEYLTASHGGKGIIFGGITGVPPTKVLIIGAGTVAEYAARTAIGMGAVVKVFDDNLNKLRRLKHSLGKIDLFTSTFERSTLARALKTTNVAIGALRSSDGRSICVVTEEMVREMRPGSVIIDVSIDNGGCFETSEPTTHQNPVYKKYGIIHYCVPNVASRVPRTATKAISNILTPILLHIAELGGVDEIIFANKGFAKGVYSYSGEITNETISRKYGMKYKELSLIIAARM
ncbi:MAG: alanine dehydrogenase [Thermoflexibacter sp.]|jgi:alanine dehydrogenase|nr:alanine dehydrogenase [Thermoflexibacter sp.]